MNSDQADWEILGKNILKYGEPYYQWFVLDRPRYLQQFYNELGEYNSHRRPPDWIQEVDANILGPFDHLVEYPGKIRFRKDMYLNSLYILHKRNLSFDSCLQFLAFYNHPDLIHLISRIDHCLPIKDLDPQFLFAGVKFFLRVPQSRWVEEVRKEENTEFTSYLDIDQENPLGIPDLHARTKGDQKIDVFHWTGTLAAERILQEGWAPTQSEDLDYNSIRRRTDQRIDEALGMGSRSETLFAFLTQNDPHVDMLKGGKRQRCIRLSVDPRACVIGDASLFVFCLHALLAENETAAHQFAQKYANTAMTVDEYLKLPPKDRHLRLAIPEVLVPPGQRDNLEPL